MGDDEVSKVVTFTYTNWRGVTSVRCVVPLGIEFKSTEWHPEAQWILSGRDMDKQAVRSFAMKDISNWKAT